MQVRPLYKLTCEGEKEITRKGKNSFWEQSKLMETEASSCPVDAPQGASNFDELLMKHSLKFADNLKDLKNIRKQLYSAAEHFELSYCKDTPKQLVMETLRDYISRALINTVDHLGTLAFKVNNFLDEKIDEVSGAELRISCIEQKLRTYQNFIDCGGLSQQSLQIKTPKYHKQYVIPSADTRPGTSTEHDPLQSRNAVEAIPMESPSSIFSMPFAEPSSPGAFSFARVVCNKQVSPHRSPLKRSSTLISSIIPTSPKTKHQYPMVPRRSTSLNIHAEWDRTKQIQQYSKKSKPLFKALLSLRKQNKDVRLCM
ncbi:hypothetical protein NMG60_11026920 [Bertholletia excelsa]